MSQLFVRVDDFPAWAETMVEFVPSTDFEEFHRVLFSHGIPYMVAVTPQPAIAPLDSGNLATRPLTEAECAILLKIANEGGMAGLHGATHHTRQQRPHSEFLGLDDVYVILAVGGVRFGTPVAIYFVVIQESQPKSGNSTCSRNAPGNLCIARAFPDGLRSPL